MPAQPNLPNWIIHLLLLVAGAAVTLSFAPFEFAWVSLLSCAALAGALNSCSMREATLRGWSFGAGLFLGGTSWVYVSMHDYGYLPTPIATLLTLLFCVALGLLHALSGWLYARWVRRGLAGRTLGFASLWVMMEWLRSWLLTGFPWLYLGYAHIDSPLSGWAPVTGVLGISFVISLGGAALAQLLINRRQWLPLLASVALALLGYTLSTHSWTQPSTAEPIRVAAVQANIPQDQKWLPSNYLPTLMLYQTLSEPLFADNDIVIWPEAAIPAYYHQALDFFEPMAKKAEEHNSTLISGVPYWSFSRSYNSIIALGTGEGRYDKQHLVPFGEYVPLYSLLGDLISLFELPMSNFSAGSTEQENLLAAGYRLAPFICYEIVFPDLVAKQARDADVLLTISNDAWFGRSFGPAQHMQMAQMRALENGRPLVRVTSTGISAITDARGRIVNRIPSHERAVLSGQVLPYQGQTPFSRFGSLPILALCAALLMAGQLRRSAVP